MKTKGSEKTLRPVGAHFAEHANNSPADFKRLSESFFSGKNEFSQSITHSVYWGIRSRGTNVIGELNALLDQQQSFVDKDLLDQLTKEGNQQTLRVLNEEHPRRDEIKNAIFYGALEECENGKPYGYILLYWCAAKYEWNGQRYASILYHKIIHGMQTKNKPPSDLVNCAFAALTRLSRTNSTAKAFTSMIVRERKTLPPAFAQHFEHHVVGQVKGIDATVSEPDRLADQLLTTAMASSAPDPEALLELANQFGREHRSETDREYLAKTLYEESLRKYDRYDEQEQNTTPRKKFFDAFRALSERYPDHPHINYYLGKLYLHYRRPYSAYICIKKAKTRFDISGQLFYEIGEGLVSLSMKKRGDKKQHAELAMYADDAFTLAGNMGHIDACIKLTERLKNDPYLEIFWLGMALKLAYLRCKKYDYQTRFEAVTEYFKTNQIALDPKKRLKELRIELCYPLGVDVDAEDILRILNKSCREDGMITELIELSENERTDQLETSLTNLITYFGCFRHLEILCESNQMFFHSVSIEALEDLFYDDVQTKVFYEQKKYDEIRRLADKKNLLATAASLVLLPEEHTDQYQRRLGLQTDRLKLIHYFIFANRTDYASAIFLFEQLNTDNVKKYATDKKVPGYAAIYHALLMAHPMRNPIAADLTLRPISLERLEELTTTFESKKQHEQLNQYFGLLKIQFETNKALFLEAVNLLRKYRVFDNQGVQLGLIRKVERGLPLITYEGEVQNNASRTRAMPAGKRGEKESPRPKSSPIQAVSLDRQVAASFHLVPSFPRSSSPAHAGEERSRADMRKSPNPQDRDRCDDMIFDMEDSPASSPTVNRRLSGSGGKK